MGICTATEMIPTIEMIPATEMIPNRHRNDPHHQNDTGGHHRNDPGISGMELRGLQKLDNNLERTFYLFLLYLFYGV